jgi:Fe-S-cluster containining protein
VKDVLLLTPAFAPKWDAVVVDLQRLILRRQESLPLLAAHGIVFEMLNSLAHGFFNQVCRPEVTVDQVGAALSDLYVEPDSEWFRTIYAIAERRSYAKRCKPASVDEVGERTKKTRTEPKENKVKSGRKDKTPPCIGFNSTKGCPLTDCTINSIGLLLNSMGWTICFLLSARTLSLSWCSNLDRCSRVSFHGWAQLFHSLSKHAHAASLSF